MTLTRQTARLLQERLQSRLENRRPLDEEDMEFLVELVIELVDESGLLNRLTEAEERDLVNLTDPNL